LDGDNQEGTIMKAFALVTTLALAVAFMGSAFAGAPITKADCEAAGGKWDAATNTCKG
jgi:hypothetical protein